MTTPLPTARPKSLFSFGFKKDSSMNETPQTTFAANKTSSVKPIELLTSNIEQDNSSITGIRNDSEEAEIPQLADLIENSYPAIESNVLAGSSSCKVRSNLRKRKSSAVSCKDDDAPRRRNSRKKSVSAIVLDVNEISETSVIESQTISLIEPSIADIDNDLKVIRTTDEVNNSIMTTNVMNSPIELIEKEFVDILMIESHPTPHIETVIADINPYPATAQSIDRVISQKTRKSTNDLSSTSSEPFSLRINFLYDRIRTLLAELEESEKQPNCHDRELGLQSEIDSLLKFCLNTSALDASSELPLKDSGVEDVNILLSEAVIRIRSLIAHNLQGRSDSLSTVVTSVQSTLVKASNDVSALSIYETEDNVIISKRCEMVVSMLERLRVDQVLSEEIKQIAIRELYGYRGKISNVFEECVPAVSSQENSAPSNASLAVFRWEVILVNNYFTDAEHQQIIKDIRAVRGRYGRLISAICRVIDGLQRNLDGNKQAELERRMTKANADLEKAKDRKQEFERKRDAKALEDRERKERDSAERLRKEEEKETARLAKLALKEEQRQKKQDQQREKYLAGLEGTVTVAKKVTEQKKIVELEKQKNFLKNFLRNSTSSSPLIDKRHMCEQSTSMIADNSVIELFDSSEDAVNCTVDISTTHQSSIYHELEFDMKAFDNAIRDHNYGMVNIIDLYKLHSLDRSSVVSHRRSASGKRRLVTLFVSVAPAEGYIEDFADTRAVRVDNRMRTLRFHTDERPPYVGTFSKKSRILSGRRPFAKDNELFNYDYDSEAEWEAEDEDGEDIEESIAAAEDEDDALGVDGLIYDDFFLKDGDFGSDADSDGEEMAATLIRRVSANANKQALVTGYAVDIVGPKFLNVETPTVNDDQLDAETRDEQILHNYCSLAMCSRTLFPLLGASQHKPVGFWSRC